MPSPRSPDPRVWCVPDGPQAGNDLTAYVSGDAFRSGGRLLALRAGQYASLFVCSIIVARALGPPERAEYALVLSLAAIVWVMISAGLDSAASRILGRREGSLEDVARLLSAAALVLGAIGMALTFGVGLLLQDSVLQGASALSIALGAATVPCLLVTQYSSALLFRMGALSSYGRVVVIAGLLQLALLAATVSITDLTAQSALVIALVVSASIAAGLAVALARVAGRRALLPSAPRELRGAAARAGVQFHASSVALYLNLKVDLLIVAAMLGATDAGLYSLAVILVDVLFAASQSMSFGAVETQTHAPAEQAARYTVDFIRQNVALAFLLAMLATAAAYPAITIIYGSEWAGAVLPFAILTVAIIGLSVETPSRNLLVRIGRPRQVAYVSIAGMVTNVAFNLALIPALGIAGSALASVLSYWLAGALMLALLSRETGLRMSESLALPRRDDVIRRIPRQWLQRRAIGREPGAAG